ncbi:LytTR family transcriptional regulator DNA-binding domain-containing protein [Gemella sp. GH3]|uniref:LytTR family DNA-binding domain-containing protein n=1 Tax=unclassified Gemella TaxID=2624949 RepID=UPI0015CFD321|nr:MULTISPECIES: LytTR family DNA-binding domain-containing protein [unclassified Gemella]MBF0713358.1 LytTR family transcriptional regulator DNA-binding domain-containing protein [Gemella sp. GH3.1]NYS50310.1 LytTR family transcriptional regulator DNA-binding domain-containing protein [Gemella sp. GH3]
MKIEIITDTNEEDLLIKIFTKNIDNEVQKVISLLNKYQSSIIGLKDNQAFILEEENIIRVYIENKKVFIKTTEDIYTSKKRLYEIENSLGNNFIKISQSEIANIKYIKKLDFSYTGTIMLIFKNNDKSFVSRRALKNFKDKLGI